MRMRACQVTVVFSHGFQLRCALFWLVLRNSSRRERSLLGDVVTAGSQLPTFQMLPGVESALSSSGPLSFSCSSGAVVNHTSHRAVHKRVLPALGKLCLPWDISSLQPQILPIGKGNLADGFCSTVATQQLCSG